MDSKRNCFFSTPVVSPSLPKFSIDANVCKNPACLNFGVSQADIKNPKLRYEFKASDDEIKYKCKGCNQTRLAYSNTSLLEAFHRSLQHSIPYAACPDKTCENHYVNIFEYYHGDARDRKEKLYRDNKNKDYYQARCRRCTKPFTLSKSLKLHINQRRYWQKELNDFIVAVASGSGASKIMNQYRLNADRYYSQLKAASNRLLEYNNFHLSKLKQGAYKPGLMRVYTDCIVCSVKTYRKDKRSKKLKFIVSSGVHESRSLILAFHPLFDYKEFDDLELMDDEQQPLEYRRYDYIKHHFNDRKKDAAPLLGLGGHFIDDYYGYMSHFLVIKKLLKKVKTLEFYMDGEPALYNAALNAFADDIKKQTCDIVLIKADKNTEKNKERTQDNINKQFNKEIEKAKRAYKKVHPKESMPDKNGGLRSFLLLEEMKNVNHTIQEKSTNKNGVLFPEPLSRIYKQAIRQSKKSENTFWINDRLSNKYNADIKLLWLTRNQVQSNTEHELNLYINANLFYIDNVFAALRKRCSSAARPTSTATGHKNYNNNSELPITLIRDFTINVVFWNFFQHFRSKNKETIAYVHGLVAKPESPSINTIFKGKYTFDTAKRMSKWLGT